MDLENAMRNAMDASRSRGGNGPDAERMRSGCGADAEWMRSGCGAVLARLAHNGGRDWIDLADFVHACSREGAEDELGGMQIGFKSDSDGILIRI